MASSRYWELTVEVPEEASEGVTNFVWELGALGVVEEEAPGRPPRLRAFFPKTTFARALEESVREYLAGLRELGFPGAGEARVLALAHVGSSVTQAPSRPRRPRSSWQTT